MNLTIENLEVEREPRSDIVNKERLLKLQLDIANLCKFGNGPEIIRIALVEAAAQVAPNDFDDCSVAQIEHALQNFWNAMYKSAECDTW